MNERTKAKLKRQLAMQLRQAALGFSLRSDRELLLRDADTLEDEADRLDIDSPALALGSARLRN
jgi:hypothetical protein